MIFCEKCGHDMAWKEGSLQNYWHCEPCGLLYRTKDLKVFAIGVHFHDPWRDAPDFIEIPIDDNH